MVAKVLNTKMKIFIMERRTERRGTNFSISDQFPPEILKRRRILHPIMTEARKSNGRIHLVIDKLYINGKLYVNPDTTYWLGGGDNTRQTVAYLRRHQSDSHHRNISCRKQTHRFVMGMFLPFFFLFFLDFPSLPVRPLFYFYLFILFY